MFCRALCLAAGRWAKSNDTTVSALVLNDATAPDARYVNGGFATYAMAGKSKTKFIRQYLRQIRRTRYDWIIFGHVSLSPLALLAKYLNPGVKTGVAAYGIEVWRPLTKLQREALKRADVVLAISEHTKAQVVKHSDISPYKVRIFPPTLDPYWEIAPYPPMTSSTRPMILSVARMNKDDRYKGIDNVIRSLPAVVREAGPVEYRVVGNGDDVPHLRALAADLGMSSYVNFIGSVEEAELREQYKSCLLFVMPSNNEGFGIVFLEAMAYGKPVVGGAHGGTPSVVKDGETGLLVDSSDVASIADSITRLLTDKALSEKYGRAGRMRLLDEFTFEQFERNLQEVLG
ncbi:MAG: glycosyltransferase family 4 protein, partial [Acidobacteriota bacterium]|nr:glycosyltransferase family 4 protein [Acidobacteriota bacterium]